MRALPGLLLLEEGGEHDALLLLVEPLAGAPRQRQLTARDASSGREWWRRPVEREGPAQQLRTLQVGKTLVVMLPHLLWGLDPQSGRMLWQRALDAAPARSCASGRDFGLIDEKGGFAAYSSATGSPSALARAACAPVYDSHSDAPNFAFIDAASATRWLPRDDEFAVERGLLPSRGTAQVVLGTPKSGASRDTANVGVLSGRRWLWQANVANEAPDGARFTTPPLAAVRGERVVVPYVTEGGVVLTALELASGERRWTTALPGSTSVTSSAPSGSENQAGELAISRRGHAAYRQASGKLWVLSLDTGAIEWSLECKQ